jgi:two-component system response regulator PrrA
MPGPLVLIVDDDEPIRTALQRGLERSGFSAITASDGLEGLALAESAQPAAIVLDVGMPGINGVDLTRRLRADGSEVPICILSARGEVDDRVAGLQAGADDYVSKPFATKEVAARLHALLRRRPTESPDRDVRTVGDLRVDRTARRAWRADHELELTRREWDLLDVLVANHDLVLAREQLLELVWGYDFEVDTNVIDVFVGYLRRKLEVEGQPRMIHTVRGVGFTLRAP